MRGTITVNSPPSGDKSEPPKTFTFDTVFGPQCKQVDVYNEVARPIVDCVLEGYNGQFIIFLKTNYVEVLILEPAVERMDK